MILSFLKEKREEHKKSAFLKNFFYHFNMQPEAKICSNLAKKSIKNISWTNFWELPKL